MEVEEKPDMSPTLEHQTTSVRNQSPQHGRTRNISTAKNSTNEAEGPTHSSHNIQSSQVKSQQVQVNTKQSETQAKTQYLSNESSSTAPHFARKGFKIKSTQNQDNFFSLKYGGNIQMVNLNNFQTASIPV